MITCPGPGTKTSVSQTGEGAGRRNTTGVWRWTPFLGSKPRLGREDAALRPQPQREKVGNSGYLAHLSRVMGNGGRRQKRGGMHGAEQGEQKAG